MGLKAEAYLTPSVGHAQACRLVGKETRVSRNGPHDYTVLADHQDISIAELQIQHEHRRHQHGQDGGPIRQVRVGLDLLPSPLAFALGQGLELVRTQRRCEQMFINSLPPGAGNLPGQALFRSAFD